MSDLISIIIYIKVTKEDLIMTLLSFWTRFKYHILLKSSLASLKVQYLLMSFFVVIKLFEKTRQSKGSIQNWKALSFLNGWTSQKTPPFLISSNQSAYVGRWFITKCGWFISILLVISDSLKIDGLLATIDIQKAVDLSYDEFEVWH